MKVFRIAFIFLFCVVTSCRKEPTTLVSKDLTASLQDIDLVWDTGCIDVGSSEARSSLHGSWSSDKKALDGTTFALAPLKGAYLLFNSVTSSGKKITVRCKTAAAQAVTPVINGKNLPQQTIGSRWQQYEFNIPKEYLRTGLNSFGFEGTGRFGIAIDSACFGGDESETVSKIFETNLKDSESKRVITAPPRSLLGIYLKVPENASLKVDYGLLKDSLTRKAAAQFSILIEAENLRKETLFSEVVKYGYLFSPCGSALIDLGKYKGKIVRVSLETSTVQGSPAPKGVYWEKALLLTPPRPATTASKPKKRDGKPANIIIYLVDTLRADHLEPYGYDKPTSPRLREFAKNAVVFDHAYAQATWTRTSVACILTGVYASSHLVEDRLDVLPDFIPSIQSVLKSKDFRTYGFVTNGNVSSNFGFDRYFDKYLRLGESKKTASIHAQSDKLYEMIESLSFLLTEKSKPFFMYVHASDPHAPYTVDAWASPGLRGCETKRPDIVQADIHRKGSETQQADFDCIVSLYDQEVHRSDLYFGKFLDFLKKHQAYENSMIVFTGDHGESFGEHGSWGHGKTLYEPELRVPLIVKLPENQSGGSRVQRPVRHIDIFPTALELLSYELPPGVQGASLLPLVQEKKNESDLVFSELILDNTNKKSLILDRYKLIANCKVGKPDPAFALYEMFDIFTDPGEMLNLTEEKPVLFRYMKKELNEWAELQAKRKAALKKPTGAALDKETEEILRALGYLQ